MYHIKKIPVFILACLLLGGCVSGQSSRQAQPETSEVQIELPPRYVLGPGEEPAADVKIVLSALVSSLRGDWEPSPHISFDPGGKNLVERVDFLSQGFGVSFIDITGYQAQKTGDERAEAFIEGYFQFKDIIGRMVSFYFAATYSHTPKGLSILSSTAMPLPSFFPSVETYFVPCSAFDTVDLSEFGGFLDLYLFALDNSVPMAANEQEKSEYEARKNSVFSGSRSNDEDKGDYYILSFCMNWVAPESSLEMVVSKKAGAGGKSLVEPVYLSWDNWRVMVAGGNFNPHADRDLFYVNVFYHLNPPTGDGPILIGTFSNQKNFEPPRPASFKVNVVQRQADVLVPEETTLGPLESGYVFLDPSRKSDARAIQEQLARLGYYKMKVDGVFGKGSRRSLSKFKSDRGLGGSDEWDIEVQKVLFKDSGL